MTMSATEQTVPLEPPHEVDVDRIEQELVQLWKSAAEGHNGGDPTPVVRACTLNFIVVEDNERAWEELGELVARVTVEHPSRTFLIALQRATARPLLDAWISARCSMPEPGGKQVCCEEIHLRAQGPEVGKIPSVVTSLLVPDVSTVLLWKSTIDSRDSVLRSLVRLADRVLIDTSELLNPLPALQSWQEFIVEQGGRTTFCDLAWTHLTPWRAQMANAFQPAALRKHLLEIEEVEVRYTASDVPLHSGFSQGMLLIGWLASRLGWTMTGAPEEKESRTVLRLLTESGTVVVCNLTPGALHDHKHGGIQSISLRTRSNMPIEFRDTTGEDSEAALVARELEVLQADRIYEAALGRIVDW